MSTTIFDIAEDYFLCELCEVYTPSDYCEMCDESTCEFCLAEYGCDGINPLHP